MQRRRVKVAFNNESVAPRSAFDWYRQNWSLVLLVSVPECAAKVWNRDSQQLKRETTQTIEFCLDIFFIWYGPLHPIDYPTYLAQIRTIFTKKTFDYAELRGPTGPLVYPAGHVIIYTFYERIFGVKEDRGWISYTPAQLTFVPVQLAVTYVVHRIYRIISPQPYFDCVFFLFTVRVRNVFVNGMFNDTFETFFAYVALYMLLRRRDPEKVIGVYSIALSIKMNAALWAPAVATHYLCTLGWWKTLKACRWGFIYQIVIALPFLYGNAYHYITRSFQLGRTFFWAISVSWKWVPKEIFEWTGFVAYLQGFQIVIVAFFMVIQRWIYMQRILPINNDRHRDSVDTMRLARFVISTHFAGVVFARSLHYSFYLWYFHTIPFLLRATKVRWSARIAFAISLEIAWNQWQPYKGNTLDSCATWWGSFAMFFLHCLLLVMLYGTVGPERNE